MTHGGTRMSGLGAAVLCTYLYACLGGTEQEPGSDTGLSAGDGDGDGRGDADRAVRSGDGDGDGDGLVTGGGPVKPTDTRPGDCPDPASLPEIGGNEGPFTLCDSDADCPEPGAHLCHGAAGATGFCATVDADTACDGDEVHLRTRPALADWGSGICIPPSWRDYLCCIAPGDFECDEDGPCTLETIEEIPSPYSPMDGCVAQVSCGSTTLEVECDGENDGTNTSLCTCYRDGQYVADADRLYDGEGTDACLAAAFDCGATEL